MGVKIKLSSGPETMCVSVAISVYKIVSAYFFEREKNSKVPVDHI